MSSVAYNDFDFSGDLSRIDKLGDFLGIKDSYTFLYDFKAKSG